MRNLHKYYYKEYFSLEEVPIKGKNRHLDYELLVDDVRKKCLERDIDRKNDEKKQAKKAGNRSREEKLEKEIDELKEQLAVNVNILKVRNGILTAQNLLHQIQQNPLVNNSFQLQISYPGLVTGIGINHEASIEGEFKLGVHFDWTHGMPVVYGSSVKGVLRSAFKDGYVDADLVKKANEKDGLKNDEKVPEWVRDEKNMKAITDDLFEGKGKSIYERDIFFDAVIVEADRKGRILASDSITPHGDNPLKNPIPITFMKIASGCKMEFRFKLVDSDINGKPFTAAQKKTLFEEILKTVGVGAKTNVGYGQLK